MKFQFWSHACSMRCPQHNLLIAGTKTSAEDSGAYSCQHS
jgi:hypothetical protein